ncbi:hypothetical protein [Lysobacter auxotrophicus]|uniref:Glycosyltransferase RgtA/B/C/D-like domain-containing protein n=1 Tax=Lysobacter auxotrophicus TaxID=2992573 RepID=A0ABM8DFW7_9GAMM|nr:hypothetical protein [Lysobacter auxotrophicus]BDU17487.1 hypothetical protein LA521A_26880 [Lysobacter auxotrophicus]
MSYAILHLHSWRTWLLLGALIAILLVNREFAVADNGDYTRYNQPYVTHPTDLETNWPEAGTADHAYRFFNQPLFYWHAAKEQGASWFTSATIFWWVGNQLNRLLYSTEVVNLRYIGLPFFLLQAVVLLIAARKIRTGLVGAIATIATTLVFTDGRLSAYYNSFFAEGVPILALLVTFAFLTSRALGEQEQSRRWGTWLGWCSVVLLCLAVLAKRQYLYFCVPATLAAYFLLIGPSARPLRQRLLAFGAIALTVTSLLGLASFALRAGDASEGNAARITSYNALYYGLLPHSTNPADLIAKLGLPPTSVEHVGKPVWRPEALQFVENEASVNVRTFLRAIALEPAAFAKSAFTNAREIGNLDVPLGNVHGQSLGAPPVLVTLPSRLSTWLSGRLFFVVALGLGIVLALWRTALPYQQRLAHQLLALMLLAVLCADLLVSTFDGQQEARKHLLLGSIAAMLLYVQALWTLVAAAQNRQAGRLERRRPWAWGKMYGPSTLENSERLTRLLWAVAVAGALARIATVAFVPLEPISDFKRYFDVAAGFAQNGALAYHQWPFVSQGPTYPLFLGAVFKLFGTGVWQGKIANLILSLATLGLFTRYCAQSNWRPVTRLTLVTAFALHPGLVTYSVVLGTETIAVFLVVCAFALIRIPSRAHWLAAGVVLGVFVLARPQFLPAVALFITIAFLRSPDRRLLVSSCAIALALTMTPWLLRNHALFDRWIPVSASSGYILLANNNSANDQGGWMPLSSVEISPETRQEFTRANRAWLFEEGDENAKVLKWTPDDDALARSEAIRWIVEHPVAFTRLGVQRLRNVFLRSSTTMLYWPLGEVGVPRWLARATNIITTLSYATAILAIVFGWRGFWARQNDWFVLAAGLVVAGLGAIFVFEGQGRYALPMLPAALILCAVTLDWASNKLRTSRTREASSTPAASES